MTASIEDILRDLEASGEDEQEDEEDSGDTKASGDSSTIKAIRESQKKWEKQAKELAKEVKSLRTFKTETEAENRKVVTEAVFKELGLPDKQAALFLKTHEGDVTADAVKQFVQDYGLADLAQETGGTTDEKSKGFEPGGVGGKPLTPALVPRAEWLSIAETDPARAEQLFLDNKVDLSDIEAMTRQDADSMSGP